REGNRGNRTLQDRELLLGAWVPLPDSREARPHYRELSLVPPLTHQSQTARHDLRDRRRTKWCPSNGPRENQLPSVFPFFLGSIGRFFAFGSSTVMLSLCRSTRLCL